jgi:DNA-binding transcriptional regulator GbsR (MarR family)
MKELLKKMEVLSHECKIYAIHLLLNAEEPLYACEIMDAMGKKQYQISRCLSTLHEAGLVTETWEGRFLLYALDKSNDFNKAIFRGILALDTEANPALKENLTRLKKRLRTRVDGKPTVTYCC